MTVFKFKGSRNGLNQRKVSQYTCKFKNIFSIVYITRDKEGPSNSTSAHLPKETQTLNGKDTHVHMFPAALCTIVKIGKQPQCPPIG